MVGGKKHVKQVKSATGGPVCVMSSFGGYATPLLHRLVDNYTAQQQDVDVKPQERVTLIWTEAWR